MKLRVILFDKNCEPVPTNTFLEFVDDLTSMEIADDQIVFARLVNALMFDKDLHSTATNLGYGMFNDWDVWFLSIQHDTRNNTIHIRDKFDCIGEPGNILAMIDLTLVE